MHIALLNRALAHLSFITSISLKTGKARLSGSKVRESWFFFHDKHRCSLQRLQRFTEKGGLRPMKVGIYFCVSATLP